MNEVVIVSTARTPVGDFMGSLKSLSGVDLGLIATKGALERGNISPNVIEEVAAGCIYKNGQKGNPARQIQIKSGMPSKGWAYTLDQQCASGMKAFELIYQSLALGKISSGLAIGMESMTNTPYLLLKGRQGYRMGDGKLIDSMLYDGLVCAMEGYHMGITAENLAKKYNISREEQDELALLSHQRATKAQKNNLFKNEIVPVEIKNRKGTVVVDKDEHPKDDLTLEKLASLRPAFDREGTVTAGNASSINDGAAAIVMMTAEKAKELELKPLAKVLTTSNYGVDPSIMGIGPAYAIPKSIKDAGLTADDIDYYEINEAFAAQFLAVNRELNISMDKVNVNGSGISLGHPVGCTGARIIQALIFELKRRKEKYGVASLCVGGGPSMSVVIENME
ncbi:MAG: acetyl-CoA C-acetyltransferase [Bacillota bacterium]|nr:acetyl-CoA C-acetyltransferase [Bacillota bacterium]